MNSNYIKIRLMDNSTIWSGDWISELEAQLEYQVRLRRILSIQYLGTNISHSHFDPEIIVGVDFVHNELCTPDFNEEKVEGLFREILASDKFADDYSKCVKLAEQWRQWKE